MNWLDCAAQGLYGGTTGSQQGGDTSFCTGQMMYIDSSLSNSSLNWTSEPPMSKPVEVSEFKKLSNHKFHELLEKFNMLKSGK